MTNFVPIFPLAMVVYPGEKLNLHIFEPRYRQLVSECYTESKPFGIPTVLSSGVAEMGTLVQIKEIAENVRRWQNGHPHGRPAGIPDPGSGKIHPR
jgi:Lon protease-like protein